ncbi:uncharacterized protein K460DRAFT_362636, partial [Cucurbitaria berberidis CBS 394.84]
MQLLDVSEIIEEALHLFTSGPKEDKSTPIPKHAPNHTIAEALPDKETKTDNILPTLELFQQTSEQTELVACKQRVPEDQDLDYPSSAQQILDRNKENRLQLLLPQYSGSTQEHYVASTNTLSPTQHPPLIDRDAPGSEPSTFARLIIINKDKPLQDADKDVAIADHTPSSNTKHSDLRWPKRTYKDVVELRQSYLRISGKLYKVVTLSNKRKLVIKLGKSMLQFQNILRQLTGTEVKPKEDRSNKDYATAM